MTARSIPEWDIGRAFGGSGPASSVAREANRRRLRVFLGTLVVALIVSLAYTFLRPAVYRASARLEITPAATAPASTSTQISISGPEPAKPFLTEVQVLTSRPVLEGVWKRLTDAGYPLGDLGSDPIAALQSRLQAVPVENTNVVELLAEGKRADILAPLVNAVVDVYRDRLAEAYRTATATAVAQADAEVSKLESDVAVKRRDVEGFRLRYDIVSRERGENEVLARVRNQGDALGKANERLATADGNLRALTEAAAAGKAVVRARDNPTLANLEQRASQAREDLHDLERSYTQAYLATQPQALALHARIAELDRQIAEQRRQSQQNSLAEAQEEMASAQAAVNRIKGQMAADRQEVAQFTTHFNEYQERQAALAELEKAYRDAVQRRARLEASARARMPQLRVVEAAATPVAPWRPLYWRDAAISVSGSLVLALLAMWLVELFNRSDPAPAVIVAQALAPGLQAAPSFQPLPEYASSQGALSSSAAALLPQPTVLPRELDHDEVAGLLAAGDATGRLVMLLLLSGLSTEEAIALRRSDVDLAQGLIHVQGSSPRDVALGEPLRELLAAPSADGAPILTVGGHQVREGEIDAQILSAAHDARLQRAAEVDAKCLRHTYIAHLVRQGIRFADLQRIVGPLPVPVLGVYATLSPAGPPAALASIDIALPAVRGKIRG